MSNGESYQLIARRENRQVLKWTTIYALIISHMRRPSYTTSAAVYKMAQANECTIYANMAKYTRNQHGSIGGDQRNFRIRREEAGSNSYYLSRRGN